jgi:hypothetical protein
MQGKAGRTIMGFKIPGPKGAALGKYKAACEAWVEASLAGDQFTCGLIRKKLDDSPDGPEKRTATAYLDKKVKMGAKTKGTPPPPVKKTAIDTMRLAVNLLVVSRKPFAEAVLEGVKDGKISEPILAEVKMACDAAINAVRRHSEFRNIFSVPDSIK